MNMEREDFIPFCRRQIEHVQAAIVSDIWDLHNRMCHRLKQDRILTDQDIEYRVAGAWENRAIQGFLAHHYPLGGSVQIAGVDVFVKESQQRIGSGFMEPGHVTVLFRGPRDNLEELRLPLSLAMAKVWYAFGLGNRP